jgi:hypothetical protein
MLMFILNKNRLYQISWDSMRRKNVDGSADGTVTPVGRKDDDGGDARLQSAVKVCKALPKQINDMCSLTLKLIYKHNMDGFLDYKAFNYRHCFFNTINQK